MIIFKKLLDVMEEINDIYIKLYKLELLGELNTNYFWSLVDDLKKLLIKEEKIFNEFVKCREYEYVKNDIINGNGPICSRLRDYIKVYDSIHMEADSQEQAELADKLRKIYGVCSKNIFLIYLSFHQEYIDTVTDINMKDRALSLKYYNAFTKIMIGHLLIENNFNVSRENYVDTYLVADMVKIDDIDSYDIVLDAYTDVIKGMLQQLFAVDDKLYDDCNIVAASKGIEFMIRACFAMLSDSEYELVRDDVFNIVNELSSDQNNKAIDIVDSILEDRIMDRCRVRKISLRPIDD